MQYYAITLSVAEWVWSVERPLWGWSLAETGRGRTAGKMELLRDWILQVLVKHAKETNGGCWQILEKVIMVALIVTVITIAITWRLFSMMMEDLRLLTQYRPYFRISFCCSDWKSFLWIEFGYLAKYHESTNMKRDKYYSCGRNTQTTRKASFRLNWCFSIKKIM